MNQSVLKSALIIALLLEGCLNGFAMDESCQEIKKNHGTVGQESNQEELNILNASGVEKKEVQYDPDAFLQSKLKEQSQEHQEDHLNNQERKSFVKVTPYNAQESQKKPTHGLKRFLGRVVKGVIYVLAAQNVYNQITFGQSGQDFQGVDPHQLDAYCRQLCHNIQDNADFDSIPPFVSSNLLDQNILQLKDQDASKDDISVLTKDFSELFLEKTDGEAGKNPEAKKTYQELLQKAYREHFEPLLKKVQEEGGLYMETVSQDPHVKQVQEYIATHMAPKAEKVQEKAGEIWSYLKQWNPFGQTAQNKDTDENDGFVEEGLGGFIKTPIENQEEM
jgi:hypothetical protein